MVEAKPSLVRTSERHVWFDDMCAGDDFRNVDPFASKRIEFGTKLFDTIAYMELL